MPTLVKMFNATLEDFEVQFSGRIYNFKARDFVEVPEMTRDFEEVPEYLEREYGNRGIFILRPGDDFKTLERKALIRYLETLNERINNHQVKIDEMKAQGKTPPDFIHLKKALIWKKEIMAKLEMEAPLEVIPSFLDDEARKKLGIEDKNVMKFEKEEPVVGPAPQEIKRNPSKARKSSFLEADISQELSVG